MPYLRYRTSIHSDAESVFSVMTDFDRYGEWNPWVAEIKVANNDDNELLIRFRMKTLFLPIKHVLNFVNPPESFVWREVSWFRALVYTERERRVLTKSSGAVVYSTRLNFFGPLSKLAIFLYGKVVYRRLREESQALKQYCEEKYPIGEQKPKQYALIESVDLKP